MSDKKERRILEEISYYKWGENYCCVKCGNNSFKKGKKEYSRRCTNCDYDESLFKHTAFEGLRFSITAAYLILQELFEKFNITSELKIVPAADGMISLYDYILRSKDLEMESQRIDELLQAHIKRYQPSVRELSRKYRVEENSVVKLLDKVSKRICVHNTDEMNNSYERLRLFVTNNWDKQFSYLLGMLSLPLVGKWEHGESLVRTRYYTAVCESKTNQWYLRRIKYVEVNNDVYERTILEDEPAVIYGSPRWKSLFVKVK